MYGAYNMHKKARGTPYNGFFWAAKITTIIINMISIMLSMITQVFKLS